ncbi:hypothetical protein Cni_G16675 [Canna indica]|uniref:Axial regulator YABBY 2 n=1 Tax=Canna indica TaxID=4628 RepID=A0AAQ3KI38_9LILI|nr:hypothetical protein Cni_G16675 [Canna indica]
MNIIVQKVSVPSTSLFNNIVTVRCGYCSNLLSVNMGDLLQTTLPFQGPKTCNTTTAPDLRMERGSTSMTSLPYTMPKDEEQKPPIRAPQKKRAPSAYNRFIKEEIQRIKANNPGITHKQAFSTAAKNWAHLPHIYYGLTPDGNRQPTNIDEHAPGNHKAAQSFF